MKNRCPSEHWTLHCYIETSKAEPFPNPNRELCIVTSKKTRLNRSPSQQRTLHCYIEKDKKNRCPSQQRTLHCHIEKGKTGPFPIRTGNSALLHRKGQDWTFPHSNSELCIVASKKTRLNRSPCHTRTRTHTLTLRLSHIPKELGPNRVSPKQRTLSRKR